MKRKNNLLCDRAISEKSEHYASPTVTGAKAAILMHQLMENTLKKGLIFYLALLLKQQNRF